MKTILAFDTSGPHCAACLIVDGEPTARVDAMAKGQAEHLMPMLEKMLAKRSLTWRDLDAIGVGTGPGNFTGIRIGVSAARGLALGLGIPAVGVTGFEAQAYLEPRPFVAKLLAPRDQVYLQTFAKDISDPVQVPATSPEALASADTLPPAEMITRIAAVTLMKAATTTTRPAPCYVRAADAAPPKDAPPVILA